MNLHLRNPLISVKQIKQIGKKLDNEIEIMNKVKGKGYDDDRASINLCDDKKTVREVNRLCKKYKNIDTLVLIGIGGSDLGTRAVTEDVLGSRVHKKNIVFVDTVDSDQTEEALSCLINELKKGKKFVLNGISKSGSTMETIANFEVFEDLLRKYVRNYQKYVVVTTTKGSKFWNLAKERGFETLEIPEKIGGRYSVFSSVGLFPLKFVGVSINKLLDGAKKARSESLNKDIMENPAALEAILIYYYSKRGFNIHNTFLYSKDLELVGKWYRQLLGESVGKKFNRGGKMVNAGITPIISVGTTDLHSIGQLYLGGPNDKFHSFVTVRKNYCRIKIPNDDAYDNLVKNIQGRSFLEIMRAVVSGVESSFKKEKIPFIEIELKNKAEYEIGQFLEMRMIMIMYLGALLEVNPFDQPNVESYKEITRRLLARK